LKESAIVRVEYARALREAKRDDDALAQIKELVNNKELAEETRKAARRLMYDIYEARGELDKLDFK
jgi:hypothetical protein